LRTDEERRGAGEICGKLKKVEESCGARGRTTENLEKTEEC
jgi:hypothetical protein